MDLLTSVATSRTMYNTLNRTFTASFLQIYSDNLVCGGLDMKLNVFILSSQSDSPPLGGAKSNRYTSVAVRSHLIRQDLNGIHASSPCVQFVPRLLAYRARAIPATMFFRSLSGIEGYLLKTSVI